MTTTRLRDAGVQPEWLHLPTPFDPAAVPAALTEPLEDGFRIVFPDDPAYPKEN
jgi:hypothetical protein